MYEVQEQPPAVSFIDSDGAIRTHYFDLKITLACGERIAIAVKPKNLSDNRNFEGQLELVAACVTKTFADRVMLVTDRDLDKPVAREAVKEILLHNRPAWRDQP